MSRDKQYPASAKHAEMRNGAGTIVTRFKAAFTVAVALLVVTVGLTVKIGRDGAAAWQWVFHAHQVIDCVTELSARSSARELALRNRIRSGDAAFAEVYDGLDSEAKILGEKLVLLVADNPAQIERAERIRTLTDDRSRTFAAILHSYKPGNAERILSANVIPSSRMLTALDSEIGPFRDEERRLLGERQARLDRSAKLIEVLIIVVGLTGLCVLLGCQIALSRYLTQTRRAQAEALAAKKIADKANQFKSAFLANVSHEIRTPLAAVLGYTDMLRSDKVLRREERDECLGTIRRNGEQVLTIVNDILDLSKIEAGRMTTERIPCCIVDVVADVASLFRRVAADRGLSFEVKFIDPIPEQIRTDPSRMRQILMNLVGNAVKFTERGGVRLVVSLDRQGSAAPLMRVQVIDTGLGVSREVLATLFQPFVQADVSTTRRFGGTGLGLTISRHFAELLGGTISVDSEVGKGSTFALTVATGDLAGVQMLTGVSETTRQSQPPIAIAAPKLNNIRMLLAEDGFDNQEIILFHLRHAGADVTLAENGKVAVQLASEMSDKNRPFDLILMDMQMPVMDGYSATIALRNLRYTGPIIALTANAMAHDREKCLTAGCNGFITKPVEWPAFWATVRQYVTGASEATAIVRAGAPSSAAA